MTARRSDRTISPCDESLPTVAPVTDPAPAPWPGTEPAPFEFPRGRQPPRGCFDAWSERQRHARPNGLRRHRIVATLVAGPPRNHTERHRS